MDVAGEVAGVAGDDGVGREVAVDLTGDICEVETVGRGLRAARPHRGVDVVQLLHPRVALLDAGWRALEQAANNLGRAGRDAQVGAPDAADLIGVGPDVDEGNLRLRRRWEGVALGHGV